MIICNMKNFDLRKYLAENKLLKENNFNNVKAAAKEKPGYKGGKDSFQIKTEKFGTKQFDHYPDRTGDKVELSTIGADDTRNTKFVSYDEAIEIIDNLTEGDLNENNSLNEQSSDMIKSKVEAAVDGLTKKIKSTINSEKSAQEISEIFKSVTFRMGQLLESYATYTQRVQQSNNSDDSLQKIADAEDDLNISFEKIGTDVMGRLNIRP